MQSITLQPYQELRFQVGSERIKLKLIEGQAEIHGHEMMTKKIYSFSQNFKAAVFTFHGATIELTGSSLKCHVGKKCDYMVEYLKIHETLERMRDDGSTTPICLVCKPMYAKDVGKSTLCRILLNYATRRHRAPIFVDLDPDEGEIGLPGTIGAVSVELPIDIESRLCLESPMLMHFGDTNMSAENQGIYYSLIDNMATIVKSKLENDKKSYSSGVIINTSSWSDDKLLIHICRVFGVNVVLVMDDEVLQDDLKRELDKSVQVSTVAKPVEIMTCQPSNFELRELDIKKYFYGTLKDPYNPMTSEMKFSFLKTLIYQIDSSMMLSDSLMPLGTKTKKDNQVHVSRYDGAPSDLLHHILAVSHCKIEDVLEDPQSVCRTNLMGFICVTSLKPEVDRVSILTPQELPNPMDHVLLYSNVQYMDSL